MTLRLYCITATLQVVLLHVWVGFRLLQEWGVWVWVRLCLLAPLEFWDQAAVALESQSDFNVWWAHRLRPTHNSSPPLFSTMVGMSQMFGKCFRTPIEVVSCQLSLLHVSFPRPPAPWVALHVVLSFTFQPQSICHANTTFHYHSCLKRSVRLLFQPSERSIMRFWNTTGEFYLKRVFIGKHVIAIISLLCSRLKFTSNRVFPASCCSCWCSSFTAAPIHHSWLS